MQNIAKVVHTSSLHWYFFLLPGNDADHLSNAILRAHTVKQMSDTFNVVRKGRYLSVEDEDTGVLSVCEVFVFKIPFGKSSSLMTVWIAYINMGIPAA